MVKLNRSHGWIALLLASTLAACGQKKTADAVYKAAADECQADVVANQFIVNHLDGRLEVVTADSEEEFKRGYLTENLNSVYFAEPQFRVNSQVEPYDIIRETDATTIDNWGAQRVKADQAWAQGTRGEGVIVAIIDSGMDMSHAQLKSQLYQNSGEVGVDANGNDRANNGIDDDGNGYIDDVHGYDFLGKRPAWGDYMNHGTHVSGIVAAHHNDSVAGSSGFVQGIAPNATLMPLAFLDRNGGTMSDGVLAIRYAVKQGARVINASWGGNLCSLSLREAISALEGTGVTFVAAAGNEALNVDRFKEYPASFNLAAQLTVGAVGRNHDVLAEFSNFGLNSVHIFAPGDRIFSTVPGGVASLSGTSMAAPYVTGSLALLLSAHPDATTNEMRRALYAAAYKDPNYLNASKGRLDLAAAIAALEDQITGR